MKSRRCWNFIFAVWVPLGQPTHRSLPLEPNATILHYITNDKQMQDGELLLIDAAAEYANYCSDVTRTFPVGVRFSAPQREIYDLVLTAQKEAIAMTKPGVKFDDVHARATEILVDGLRGFGLLSGDTKEIIEKGDHRKFYMHRTSHWLGMDVHDVGKYKLGEDSRILAARYDTDYRTWYLHCRGC